MAGKGSLHLEFRQSHRYSFTSPVEGGFKLSLIPGDAPATITGVHYILVLDVSGSMEGEKLETLKQAASKMLELLPDGNMVSIVIFGVGRGGVQVSRRRVKLNQGSRRDLLEFIRGLQVMGDTPLLRAVMTALGLVEEGEPTYMILLSDGRPTDGSEPRDYEGIRWPQNVKPITIGVGLDYDPRIMNIIADRGGGLFVHVSEADLEKLVRDITGVVAARGYAKDVMVSVSSVGGEARLIGYPGNEAYLPVVKDEMVEFYGEVKIPANYDGVVAVVRISYTDAATGEKVVEKFEYKVRPAGSREEFLSGIDRQLLAEIRYQSYMEQVKNLLAQGDLAAATRKLERAEELAVATMRLDLVEATRSMKEIAEQTLRTGDITQLEEATRRLTETVTRTVRRS